VSLYDRLQAARERETCESSITDRHGHSIACTREYGHSGACYWPACSTPVSPWVRSAIAHTLPSKEYRR
jgi:hypothetical protein